MNTRDCVKGFIEGTINPSEFMTLIESTPEIYDYLQSIVPKDKVFHKCYVHINEIGQNAHMIDTVPYDIRLAINNLMNLCRGQTWCLYYYIQTEIANLWKEAFPNEDIVVSNIIKNRFFYELEVIPRYIGGKEIYEYGILDKILDSLPESLSDMEKRVLIRQVLRKEFQLDENNHPYWRKEAEWPLGVHRKPMRFLYQKQDVNRYEYYFEDIATKEVRIVTQSS